MVFGLQEVPKVWAYYMIKSLVASWIDIDLPK